MAKQNITNQIPINIDLNASLKGFNKATIITAAHHVIMKHYASPLLLGPKPGDTLLSLVAHMFTEDEADLVQHLKPLRPATAEAVSKRSGRSVDDVSRVLNHLAWTKFVLFSTGDPRKYMILPIVPGTFELALMTTDISSRNQWHKEFALMFERLWDEGHIQDYAFSTRPAIRYLPVAKVKTLHAAWPSDKLEEILSPYHIFAVGNCQCRLAMRLSDKGCDRPLENCLGFGPLVQPVIDRGLMRQIDIQEAIAIKRNAEEHGCVTWMANEMGDWRGNFSCSCCGCCCHGLRIITQFNAPGLFSQPHFMPKKHPDKCTLCHKCVKSCPTQAITIDNQQLVFQEQRCIGCGLCVVSCPFDALELQIVDNAMPPEDSWISLLLKMMPGYLYNSAKVWAKRMWTN